MWTLRHGHNKERIKIIAAALMGTLAAILLLPILLFAQTQANTHVATGGTLPATCRVGDLWEKTGGSAGLYRCSAANTWTAVGGSNLVSPVGVADGGTGQTTYTDGQLLIGNTTGNTLTKATLTAGSNVTITNGSGAITIAASGGGSSGLTLLESHTASSSATLDFTTWYSATYDEYLVECVNLIPATGSTGLRMLVSTNTGSTWESSTYQWNFLYNTTATNGRTGSASDSSITLGDFSNGTGESSSYTLRVFNPGSASAYKQFLFDATIYNGTLVLVTGSAMWGTATAIDGLRFQSSSGNLTSGTCRIYGVAK